jgi:hypothetical protein
MGVKRTPATSRDTAPGRLDANDGPSPIPGRVCRLAGVDDLDLLTYSGHTSVASLAPYARVSAEALRRWQERHDPADRHRR